jgi:chemotaxis protein MotB
VEVLAKCLQTAPTMNKPTIIAVLALSGLAIGGCVSQGKYDQAVAQTETTRAELSRKQNALEQTNAELGRRHDEITKLKSEIAEINKWSYGQSAQSHSRIAQLQKRLVELEAAQAATEARAALYKDISLRLKQQIDDGELTIVIRDGRMVLQLPNDVLFDTGRTELKTSGKKALAAIAEVMKVMPHRQFQVAGHTDNVPIKNAQFASNWELSSGRALRVVHFLMEKGVDAPMLSAAGYADVDPVSSNDSVEGKKRNRRTEITLQPNIDELVKVP